MAKVSIKEGKMQTDNIITHEILSQRLSYPLEIKEVFSAKRISEWYNNFGGEVYVSFSGGKDSTVLLDLVRKQYPDVPAVFMDTGLEYPEIREFVKTIDNVVWVKPKMAFNEVLTKYGYPVVSKTTSMGISRYINTKSDLQKKLRLYGGINPTSGKKQYPSISKKWHYLVDTEFKISDKCCDVLKKNPAKLYEKETGRKPIIGTMVGESRLREQNYISKGCNSFEGSAKSAPISIWTEDNIWEYIKKYDLPYSKIYDMGYSRTGCMFCMFGVHLEKQPNRFQQMAVTHPKQYKYCINKLGLGKILDRINVDYRSQSLLSL